MDRREWASLKWTSQAQRQLSTHSSRALEHGTSAQPLLKLKHSGKITKLWSHRETVSKLNDSSDQRNSNVGWYLDRCHLPVAGILVLLVKNNVNNIVQIKHISRGENQKGVSDISPTLQESQKKMFTIVDLTLCTDFNCFNKKCVHSCMTVLLPVERAH